MKELRQHKSYPRYSISPDGYVYSHIRNHWLTPTPNHKGYGMVGLYNFQSKRKRLYVHRLVAEMFCTKPTPESLQVNHKDGDKTNNHYTNLEWCTGQQNMDHAWENDLFGKGENHGSAKFSDELIERARVLVSEGFTHKAVGAMLGISRSYISYLMSGKYRS